jgi:hypothetical protein
MAYRKGGLGSGSLHDPELLAAALVGYEHERSEIEKKIAELRRQLGGRAVNAAIGGSDGTRPAPKRTMSAAARRRIAAAQRKRWAAYRKAEKPAATKKTVGVQKATARPMRKMSAAARKRISDATKKRWAAFRAKKNAGAKKAA